MYKVVGTFSQVRALNCAAPDLNLFEYEQIISGRSFTRWYMKNQRMVDACAAAVTFGCMVAFKVSPFFLAGTFLPPLAIPVAGAHSLFSGQGYILLHMLIIGFVTLVVSTFLKFTGRGDFIPLVMFVGGAIILKECLGLFHSIYTDISTFLNL